MKKNIVFIVLLVSILTLLNNPSLKMALINFLATFILFVMYYAVYATIQLYKEQKRMKAHLEAIDKAFSKQEQENLKNIK